jgi:hypothetical protein
MIIQLDHPHESHIFTSRGFWASSQNQNHLFRIYFATFDVVRKFKVWSLKAIPKASSNITEILPQGPLRGAQSAFGLEM